MDDGAPSVAARDDLAGVVDLFDWLTRAELSRALSELAFKQRTEVDEDAIAAAIDAAIAEYALVPAPSAALSEAGSPVESDDGTTTDTEAAGLTVGPAAFPSLRTSHTSSTFPSATLTGRCWPTRCSTGCQRTRSRPSPRATPSGWRRSPT